MKKAIDAGLQIWKRGHYPFIPHLTHYVDLLAREKGVHMDWKDYLEWDRPWLETCDALLYLAPSTGADLELTMAKNLGLRIYRDVEEIPHITEERRFSLTEQVIHVSRSK